MTGVNLSVKSRIVYINYSLFMFIEAMCKGETKSRSRRCKETHHLLALHLYEHVWLVRTFERKEDLRNRFFDWILSISIELVDRRAREVRRRNSIDWLQKGPKELQYGTLDVILFSYSSDV